jgi:DNA recombination protein RmuC
MINNTILIHYIIVYTLGEKLVFFIEFKDEALENKVILCSPVTLYAILAVIRQTIDNFKLERSAVEIQLTL